jgi:hypothetical protein
MSQIEMQPAQLSGHTCEENKVRFNDETSVRKDLSMEKYKSDKLQRQLERPNSLSKR